MRSFFFFLFTTFFEPLILFTASLHTHSLLSLLLFHFEPKNILLQNACKASRNGTAGARHWLLRQWWCRFSFYISRSSLMRRKSNMFLCFLDGGHRRPSIRSFVSLFYYYYYHLVLSQKVHSIEGIWAILRVHNTYDARSIHQYQCECIWWKSKCVHTHTLSYKI